MFYIRLVILNLLLCTVFAGGIFFFFNYPLTLLLTHIALCLSVYLLSVVFSVFLSVGGASVVRTRLQPLPFSVVSTLLIFIYLGDLVSNYFWKANLNFNLIGRILNHYYHLYQLETVLIVGGSLLIVFTLVFFIYFKIFKSYYSPVERPIAVIFVTLSMTVFIYLQIYTSYHKANSKVLGSYFYGELVMDLFNDFTDSHSDYVVDADSMIDKVEQSVNYVEQLAANAQPSKKNIVMVIVDALRADHLASYGYFRDTTPFLADLIEKHNGVVVDHFFSMCDESKCGIRSILTSRGIGGQNSLQASENSLHSKLKDDGYQINFLLSSDHAFGGLKRIYYPYDFYMDGLGFKAHPLNDDRGIVATLEGWPDYNGSPNYFHFHLFSTHEAGISYGKYLGQAVFGIKPGFQVENPIDPRYATPNANKQQQRIDREDNKIFQADLVISRLLTLLKEKGYMENTLVVITADHGQGLNEHGYIGHISGLYNESLRVPLILIDTSNTSLNITETGFGNQMDIAPTVLNIVGKPVPDSWEGQALQMKKLNPMVTQHVIPNRSSSFAKIFYDPDDNIMYKYMFLSSVGGLKQERFFYDLINDPGEKLNLLETSEHLEASLKIINRWHLDEFDE